MFTVGCYSIRNQLNLMGVVALAKLGADIICLRHGFRYSVVHVTMLLNCLTQLLIYVLENMIKYSLFGIFGVRCIR